MKRKNPRNPLGLSRSVGFCLKLAYCLEWAKRDSTAPQILKKSDGFQASGFYSGVHSDSIKRDLEELISVWIERHGLESLAEVLAGSLEGCSLEQLANAVSRRGVAG